MRNQWKRTWLAAILAAAILLTGCMMPALSSAEGAEPYGDGDGVVSRAQLAGLYNWLDNISSDFYQLITFDMISDALGKQGCVKEKDRDEYHAAYWTDGDAFVTITFRDREGFWGVTSVVISGIGSEEYSLADYSFLPPVGNRTAGSSATESQTLKAKVQTTSDEVTVSAQVPVDYWTTSSSFGEARFLNVPDPSKASGNSAGLRVGFWPDEASLQADREKCENVQELEDWAALGTTLKGYAYTRNGMDMTEYSLCLKEDLWMSIRFYHCLPYAGSEAEAIVYSLTVQYGDWTYACEASPETPAGSGTEQQPANEPAGEPEAEPVPATETEGTPAPTAEPEPTEEPAGEPTAAPAAELPDAEEEAYVGVWHLIYVGTGGFTGNAADIGLAGETLTLNADHTGVLTVDPDLPTHQWRTEDGIVRLENGQRLILLREDILQYGAEQSGYMIFSKDPAAVWDGSIPMYDPFAATEPEPTEAPAVPALAAEPETPRGSGTIQTEVKYIAKTFVASGVEMDASVLGGEYAITLHDGGTLDFVMAGVQVPGLLWKTDGEAVVIDYFGSGEIRITAEGDGIALDLIGSMILKMVP